MEKGNTRATNVAVLLFDGFETLDVFGPVEILGRLTDHYRVSFYSEKGDTIRNEHGLSVLSRPLREIAGGTDVFLIPGGPGVRREVDNKLLTDRIRTIADGSGYVLTVCTGSSLLAQTGLLNGRKATSNKRVFNWATSFGDDVNWQREARWVVDGKYYTSSGVSAGMDMTLGFIRDRHGEEFARTVARHMEYEWNEDSAVDHFSQNDSRT